MVERELLSELRRGEEPHDVMARDCLVGRLRMLNREVTGIYDDALRPLGVKVSQINVLIAVAKFGPVAPGVVGELLRIEKSTLSRSVERLRAHGWIRVRPGDDERSHRLEITAAGRRLVQKSLPLWKRAQEETERLLGERTVRALRDTTERLWEGSAG